MEINPGGKMKRATIGLGAIVAMLFAGTSGTTAPAAPQNDRVWSGASGKLSDIAFFAGRWTGTAGPNTTEEVCTEASHHQITCSFRVLDAENVEGIELIVLREVPIASGGPPMQQGTTDNPNASRGRVLTTIEERVRFYSPDLSEKPGDEGITLRLASISPTEIVFDNAKESGVVKHVRIIHNGNDEFTSHIDVVGADGKPSAIEAHWKRAR
jgi:hypothetical protein